MLSSSTIAAMSGVNGLLRCAIRLVHRTQPHHLLPDPGIVEPALGRQVHPPRPEASQRLLGRVAQHHLLRLQQVHQPALLHVLLLARVQEGTGIVLIEPQDACLLTLSAAVMQGAVPSQSRSM